jgi:DNA-binding CsgD family transcriptional regulator
MPDATAERVCERQAEILRQMSAGRAVKQIARKLGMSVGDIHKDLASIRALLNAATTYQAVAIFAAAPVPKRTPAGPTSADLQALQDLAFRHAMKMPHLPEGCPKCPDRAEGNPR